ncbi:hypothetical protein N7540_005987 [Penicillium herquei]|nr:hypothetical protein N7540_005987 [Penicillium herquei]
MIPRLEDNLPRGGDGRDAVIEISVCEQVDEVALELCLQVSQGPGRHLLTNILRQPASYSIIKTSKPALSPENLAQSLYLPLRISHYGPVVSNIIMSLGKGIWVNKPVMLGPSLTFLVIKPANILQINLDVEGLLKHENEWLPGVVEANKEGCSYVCPACRTMHRTPQDLYYHFDEPNNHNEGHSGYDCDHYALAFYQSPGDWDRFVPTMRRLVKLNVPDERIPRDGSCFNLEWLIEHTFHKGR